MDVGRNQDVPTHQAAADEAARVVELTESFERFAAELRRFAIGVVRDPELAGDVMQTTFIKLLERGHEVRTANLKGWLFRVALNEGLMIRRRDSAGQRAHRRVAELARPSETRPEDRLVQREVVESVRRVVGELPPDQRRVVLARMYEDKTFAQIAAELDVPLGTVLTRMRLALKRLQQALKTEADR